MSETDELPPFTPQGLELELQNQMGEFIYDPLGHLKFCYPWGEGDLVGEDGPDNWQRGFLREVGQEAARRRFDGLKPVMPIMMATCSGHGIGKSALTAWLANWIMDTRPYCHGTVTASTAGQLETKTWAEIVKWRRRSIMNPYYDCSLGKGNMRMWRIGYKESWYCKAETCKEENSESFAGQHAKNSTSFYIPDEASGVPDKIYEVMEGGLTDGEPMLFAFGNGTRNSGWFHRAFYGKGKDKWIRRQIDSRTCKVPNKEYIAQMIAEHGEDSDYVKVRVRGMFPSLSIKQYFPNELLDPAKGKHLLAHQYNFAPTVITCDPAWEGDDELVIGMRQGLHFKILKTMDKNNDDVLIANIIANFEDQYKADGVIIDAGYGTGILSAGRAMGREWHIIWFSSASPDPGAFNMRGYMYMKTLQWLKEGGSLPDDDVLYNEMQSIETVPRLDGKIQIESKQALKKRDLSSPNRVDALVLSFAMSFPKKSFQFGNGKATMYVTDYDPSKI
jgi:hypothetical protein